MTVLIGAAFAVHHHEAGQYLAGGSESYSFHENERDGSSASESLARNKNTPAAQEPAAFNARQ
ncbi:MAG: hypothetical protein V4726_08095 [Verrucomicrobiota bacterium]